MVRHHSGAIDQLGSPSDSPSVHFLPAGMCPNIWLRSAIFSSAPRLLSVAHQESPQCYDFSRLFFEELDDICNTIYFCFLYQISIVPLQILSAFCIYLLTEFHKITNAVKISKKVCTVWQCKACAVPCAGAFRPIWWPRLHRRQQRGSQPWQPQ